MSDKHPVNPREDELDLGQVFGMINTAFTNLFKAFLRLFVYLRSNIFWLAGLAIIGFAIGYGLNKIISVKLKTEVIVSPNLESKRYLYDAVEELNGRIKAQDTAFFASIDISASQIENFEITVNDVIETSDTEKEAQMNYMEVLQKFEGNPATNELIRNMLLDQNSLDQRITFFYKDPDSGPEVARKLLDHLNDNSYFKDLVKTYNENASTRIEMNKASLEQLDAIIQKYTEGLNSGAQAEGQLVLSEEDALNPADLFTLKNTLIAQMELKQIELQERKSPLSIINFGGPQPVSKPLFGKSLFLAPFILVALFLLKDIIRYLNRKSKEMLT